MITITEFEPFKISIQTRHENFQTEIAERLKNYLESLGFKIVDFTLNVDNNDPKNKEPIELQAGEGMIITYKDIRWDTDSVKS